jgi:hypothetical protein
VYVAGCLEGETGGGPGATPWPIARRADVVLRLLLNLRESYWAPVLRCQYSGPDPQQRIKQVGLLLGPCSRGPRSLYRPLANPAETYFLPA